MSRHPRDVHTSTIRRLTRRWCDAREVSNVVRNLAGCEADATLTGAGRLGDDPVARGDVTVNGACQRRARFVALVT